MICNAQLRCLAPEKLCFPATVKIEDNTFVLLDFGLFLALQSRKPLLIYAASPQSRLR